MTLTEIKTAIAAGKKVYCATFGYEVILDSIGQYLIIYRPNGYCIGLTHQDGITLNGQESDFFMEEKELPSMEMTGAEYVEMQDALDRAK